VEFEPQFTSKNFGGLPDDKIKRDAHRSYSNIGDSVKVPSNHSTQSFFLILNNFLHLSSKDTLVKRHP